MQNSVEELANICQENLKGTSLKGICSVCSSHPGVISASVKQSLEDNSPLLIESTSNQVDQYGGYTGMKPLDFFNYVSDIGKKSGLDSSKIILGGDHLGPNRWQSEKASIAMDKACVLVEEYVKAGFRKIHLDASMPLGDDGGKVDETTVAERAAILCEVAEKTWKPAYKGDCKPYYVIGTEVPIPGGILVSGEDDKISPTSALRAESTRFKTQEAFEKHGLSAWDRVLAMVVQPGVEYGNNWVSVLDETKLKPLKNEAEKYGNLVYEAHSTDYQTENALTELVKNHFVILKVGPWVSFAYREGLYALEMMEKAIYGRSGRKLSGLQNEIEKVMLENDGSWRKYCDGKTEEELYLQRHFGLSDRIRYYWADSRLKESQQKLFDNLADYNLGKELGLFSQFVPGLLKKLEANKLSFQHPSEIAEEYTRDVIRCYHRATGVDC
ncbi:MAG: class II D-tagatose-bisphosphate aldolase, non-catalytic subunit [Sphaerochaetaceae bacterium]|nr:class II D-tagatose-bisphosphate aldolase, non-catalytic subunit [Sphaerochaetaceae bacterium]